MCELVERASFLALLYPLVVIVPRTAQVSRTRFFHDGMVTSNHGLVPFTVLPRASSQQVAYMILPTSDLERRTGDPWMKLWDSQVMFLLAGPKPKVVQGEGVFPRARRRSEQGGGID